VSSKILTIITKLEKKVFMVSTTTTDAYELCYGA
jgi:hypothetical protein